MHAWNFMYEISCIKCMDTRYTFFVFWIKKLKRCMYEISCMKFHAWNAWIQVLPFWLKELKAAHRRLNACVYVHMYMNTHTYISMTLIPILMAWYLSAWLYMLLCLHVFSMTTFHAYTYTCTYCIFFQSACLHGCSIFGRYKFETNVAVN